MFLSKLRIINKLIGFIRNNETTNIVIRFYYTQLFFYYRDSTVKFDLYLFQNHNGSMSYGHV